VRCLFSSSPKPSSKANQLLATNFCLPVLNPQCLSIILLAIGVILILGYCLIREKRLSRTILDRNNKTIEDGFLRNKLLLKEIHHRVKNNLQMISSLLSLQSRYDRDDDNLTAIKTARSRIQAVALLHQKLMGNEDLRSINIQAYFSSLIEDIQDNYTAKETRLVFHTDIEDTILDIETVIPLGLIINELIINSIKHAFVSRPTGTVSLSVNRKGNSITVTYADNGIGFPFDALPEHAESLGLEIIKSFAEKLDANVEISNVNGARIMLDFEEKKYL